MALQAATTAVMQQVVQQPAAAQAQVQQAGLVAAIGLAQACSEQQPNRPLHGTNQDMEGMYVHFLSSLLKLFV